MDKIIMELPPMPYYITIGRTQFKQGEHHPNRRNIGIFDWLLVVRGALYIGEDEKQWEVGQGQSLLLLPDRYHYATAPCRTETVFYWIHFVFQGTYSDHSDADFSLQIRHAWANPYKLRLPQYTTPRQFSRIERLLEQMLDYAGASGSAAYWKEQQQFMDLLHFLEEEEYGDNPPTSVMRLAERTEEYLRQHYQRDLKNETLAQALHFHPNYIVRCMKEIYQCTPMEYLLKIRLEQGKLLLIKTEWPVAIVAERVGFNYAPYFSSCFKRYMGMSPLAFRKLYAG
ncbi:helix-turn-helix transcriptional regulator [Paenibacillus alkalitolerans]|uniref:helix-turn-helix transcriptional regulator n=1 Tax=Paenibacillus alkalitolerans TaxID=2799335 RepID=UPI0018F782A6|nr:AraC family transcriptional regulator [Paenibacillus alkalitolerans]